MSRTVWRCKNRGCPVAHGARLGRITSDGALVLDEAVVVFRVFLDCRRGVVQCPMCGQTREFRGVAVFSSTPG